MPHEDGWQPGMMGPPTHLWMLRVPVHDEVAIRRISKHAGAAVQHGAVGRWEVCRHALTQGRLILCRHHPAGPVRGRAHKQAQLGGGTQAVEVVAHFTLQDPFIARLQVSEACPGFKRSVRHSLAIRGAHTSSLMSYFSLMVIVSK